jgi:hypothetical protein
VLRVAAEPLESRLLLSTTYQVTTTADSGAGSLRQAILNSNGNAATTGANEIDFAIGTGQQVITLSSPLPTITAPLYINATTQPGYSSSPLIQVNGYGITISAGSSTVRGLDIVSTNAGPLITIGQNGNNTIQGNWLGLDPTGNNAVGNSEYGIYCTTSGNQFGGTTAAQRNVISGSTAIPNSSNTPGSTGLYIFGNNANNNNIQGNYIGTNASGTAAVGNVIGVDIEQSAHFNTIGGTAAGAGNLISGNTSHNIFVRAQAYQTQILGNTVGMNLAGTTALNTNTSMNIELNDSTNDFIGGPSASSRNIISGAQYGIYVYGPFGTAGGFNTIQGNYVGTDATGTVAIGNSNTGLVIQSEDDTVGGTSAADRNIIAGNQTGLALYDPLTTVQGNYIGLNANGTLLANTGNGLLCGSNGNTIGGTAAGAGNVIAGNANGIVITAPFNNFQGNFIGTDPTGTTAIPNISNGILISSTNGNTIGGNSAAARNVISGNALAGISFTGTTANTATVIQGNYIGVNASGAALPNGGAGVSIAGPSGVTIGGSAAGQGNVIAFNKGDGVDVTTATSTAVKISQNSIYSNVGLGIDLGADGITNNHTGGAISGPNNFLNHPVISSVTFGASSTTVAGSFNSAASSSFTLEFFASPIGSGTLQGKTFLGNTTVSTDTNGNATFSVSTLAATAAGQLITATATDSTGDTSEFSLPATAAAPSVITRAAFYNNSVYDGNNPASNSSDDNAIAPDKHALLPGQTATYANILDYSRGVNGITIDIANLAGLTSGADFTFLAGNSATPSTWTAVGASGGSVRVGAGVNGSSRLDITFADGAVRNQWLQVTVKADAATGLTTPDVFYFGDLSGFAGEPVSGGQFTVSTADVTSALSDPRGFLSPATITDVNDFNRDGRVDATDQLIARNNIGTSLLDLQAPVSGMAVSAAQPAGQPSSWDVYMIELINRARANPSAVAAQLGINLNEGLSPGTIPSTPLAPLAFNSALTIAATNHSQWMMTNQIFSHNEGSLDPATRMANAGYVFTSPSGSAENLAGRGTSGVLIPTQLINQEFDDLFLDSSTSGRTHRLNLLNSSFTDIGVGLANGTFSGSNAMLATQDFGYSASSGPYLTGVVFNDARIHDGIYEPGEGLGGITLTAVRTSDNATFSTTSYPSGAYTLAVPAGTYTVTATGTSLGGAVVHNSVTVGSLNVEQDFTPATGSYIAGRYIFYNNSVFDGNNPAANSADDHAMATDKQALLPGVPVSFVNYTSYSRGINGIMVDIGNLPAGVTPQLSDFSFSTGNTSTPSSWTAAPTPTMTIRPGAGTGGSTRIEFTWPDGSIRNTWLQVTVAASSTTGLLTPDVFYFGNADGSTGVNPLSAAVTVQDQVVTLSNVTGFLNPASITNPYDFNRDGRVDATDVLVARNSIGTNLIFFTPADPNDSTNTTAQPAASAPASTTTGTRRIAKLVNSADHRLFLKVVQSNGVR